jgi:hypothetical protein
LVECSTVFREALTYPLRGDDAEQTLLVGVILSLAVGVLARLGVLALLALVPALLLAGYALAVVRATAESASGGLESTDEATTKPAGGASSTADAPPRFSDFRALAADGARALVVAAGYLLVPTVALAVTVGGAATGGRPEGLGTTVFVFGAGTVVLVTSLAFAYLLPAALSGVARTGGLAEAVERERLGRLAGDARYFVGWVAALLVGLSAVVVLGSLAALGRPGEVAALALSFYALVVVARLVGRGVAR